MNQEVEKSLEQLGFTENEIAAYLGLLRLGESRAAVLATQVKLSRPYTYAVLENLERQGLVLSLERNGVRLYRPVSPERLRKILSNRLAIFDQFVPGLMMLYGSRSEQPLMRWFEGKEGLRAIHEEILAEADQIDIFGSTADWLHAFDDWEDFTKRLAAKKANIRDIAQRLPQTEQYQQYYQQPGQEIRFTLPGWHFPSDVLIWGNKIALLTYRDHMHGAVIESSSIATTLRGVVDILWPLAQRA